MTNKDLERALFDANMKSSYLQRGEVGNFVLYSLITSKAGRRLLFFLFLLVIASMS